MFLYILFMCRRELTIFPWVLVIWKVGAKDQVVEGVHVSWHGVVALRVKPHLDHREHKHIKEMYYLFLLL